MSPDQMSTFFALLALGALVLTGAILVAAVALRGDPRQFAVRPLLIPVAFLIAATAMAGSLYYSESANYTPCEFCWYQRICMYPLAGILGVAALRRDERVGLYALPIAVAGIILSVYHYQLQVFPDQGSSCDASAPCSFQWVDKFGFVSIPFMAGSAFLAIIALVGTALLWDHDGRQGSTSDDVEPMESTQAPVPPRGADTKAKVNK